MIIIIYIYIYVCRERERERNIVSLHFPVGMLARRPCGEVRGGIRNPPGGGFQESSISFKSVYLFVYVFYVVFSVFNTCLSFAVRRDPKSAGRGRGTRRQPFEEFSSAHCYPSSPRVCVYIYIYTCISLSLYIYI